MRNMIRTALVLATFATPMIASAEPAKDAPAAPAKETAKDAPAKDAKAPTEKKDPKAKADKTKSDVKTLAAPATK